MCVYVCGLKNVFVLSMCVDVISVCVLSLCVSVLSVCYYVCIICVCKLFLCNLCVCISVNVCYLCVLSLCVYLCVIFVCVYLCVTFVCMCVCAVQRSTSGVFLGCFSPYHLQQGLSLSLTLTDWLNWLVLSCVTVPFPDTPAL